MPLDPVPSRPSLPRSSVQGLGSTAQPRVSENVTQTLRGPGPEVRDSRGTEARRPFEMSAASCALYPPGGDRWKCCRLHAATLRIPPTVLFRRYNTVATVTSMDMTGRPCSVMGKAVKEIPRSRGSAVTSGEIPPTMYNCTCTAQDYLTLPNH